MKKHTVFGIYALILFLSCLSVHAQEGFTGPQAGFAGTNASGADNARQFYQPVTAAQALTLPNNSQITLTGFLVNSPRRNYYTFRDATGEIIVEIERKYWGGLSVGPNDRVQIFAELERKRNGTIEVEVAIVRKI